MVVSCNHARNSHITDKKSPIHYVILEDREGPKKKAEVSNPVDKLVTSVAVNLLPVFDVKD